jgi:nitrilase
MSHSRTKLTIINSAWATPSFPNSHNALERACELIVDASEAGADWILFPEAFIPGYPAWIWSIELGADHLLGEILTDLLAEAVAIPSDTTDRLCRIAQRSQINVVIGLVERAEAALYSTLLVIDAHGRLIGRYRAQLPQAIQGATWLTIETETPAPHKSWSTAGGSDKRGI